MMMTMMMIMMTVMMWTVIYCTMVWPQTKCMYVHVWMLVRTDKVRCFTYYDIHYVIFFTQVAMYVNYTSSSSMVTCSHIHVPGFLWLELRNLWLVAFVCESYFLQNNKMWGHHTLTLHWRLINVGLINNYYLLQFPHLHFRLNTFIYHEMIRYKSVSTLLHCSFHKIKVVQARMHLHWANAKITQLK